MFVCHIDHSTQLTNWRGYIPGLKEKTSHSVSEMEVPLHLYGGEEILLHSQKFEIGRGTLGQWPP